MSDSDKKKQEDERFKEYQRTLHKLAYSLDLQTYRNNAHEIGASHCVADADSERIWISLRPVKGAQLFFFGLNPAAAFALADEIMRQGSKTGWYAVTSVDGDPVPKVLN